MKISGSLTSARSLLTVVWPCHTSAPAPIDYLHVYWPLWDIGCVQAQIEWTSLG